MLNQAQAKQKIQELVNNNATDFVALYQVAEAIELLKSQSSDTKVKGFVNVPAIFISKGLFEIKTNNQEAAIKNVLEMKAEVELDSTRLIENSNWSRDRYATIIPINTENHHG